MFQNNIKSDKILFQSESKEVYKEMTFLITNAIYFFMKLLKVTYRYKVINREKFTDMTKNGEQNYIFAIWHQNMVHSLLYFLDTPHCTLSSESKDGNMMRKVLERAGYLTAKGSSTRGGKKGLIKLIRNMRTNTPGALTVDGPKGPLYDVKDGVFELAKLTGTIVIPLAVYPEKFWAFEKSWDHFRLAKPFTRLSVYYCDPIEVPKDMDRENYGALGEVLKNSLINGEQKAINYLSQK